MSNAAYALPDRELVLDRYRPLRPIGRGGSGSVWLARDERSGLEVALKIVPREGKRAARAMREMEAASRLRHERCVRAYDFGGDDGHVYIAYEYVAGSTLRELMRAGRLTDGDAIEVAAQVLEGLAHAHQRGIVHRDVKPSNIIVEDGPVLSVRLLDFGLAQFEEADTLTAIGDVPGTLAYIAPERLQGKHASVRSDVWAVGVLLWEALAGQHPFWGVPLPQVANTITAGAPALGTQRPDIARRIQSLVDGALSVDPARRPDARDLAEELRDAQAAPRRPGDRARERGARQAARTPTRPRRPTRETTSLDERPQSEGAARRDRLWLLLHAGAATAATAVGGSLLPFWPPLLLAIVALAAGLAALRLPRLALAIVLFAPVFPLGNLARGAALAYALVALLWLAATWREPRKALLFASGPVLASVGLLAALPVAVASARSPLRRALHAAGGVLTAALLAGVSAHALPFSGGTPDALHVEAEGSAIVVARVAWEALVAANGTLAAAAVLAVVAAALPFARRKGRVEIAVLAAAQLLLLLVLAPHAPLAGALGGTAVLAALLLAPDGLASIRRRAAQSTG